MLKEKAPASQGCLVERVQAGSRAQAAGLQAGDVIVEASSTPIRSADDLRAAVSRSSGEFTMVVQRGSSNTTLVAQLKSENARDYRLGMLCAEDAASPKSPAGSSSIYIGPMFSWMSVGGDFDGNQVLINPQAGSLAAVPEFDSTVGYGGQLGYRSRLPATAIDLAFELSYQQGNMANSFAGSANDKNATLHDFGFSLKSYFMTDNVLQPVIGAGLDIPWLTVPEAIINTSLVVSDENFSGIGYHVGAGLCYYVEPQVSFEAFVAYYWRHFNSLSGSTIDDPLSSHSIEPSISIRYHFAFGKTPEKNNPPLPKV